MLTRYEWIQFYILYFIANAIEYVEIRHKTKHLMYIEALNTLSNTFIHNKSN